MYHSLYSSRATIAEGDPAHQDILEVCHRNNAENGLTGFLHREAGFFLQYLEGPEDALKDTLERIRKDPRHENVSVLSEGPIKSRNLPDWQMGFCDTAVLTLADMLTLPTDDGPLTVDDPFDLIVFVVANAGFLRENAQAA